MMLMLMSPARSNILAAVLLAAGVLGAGAGGFTVRSASLAADENPVRVAGDRQVPGGDVPLTRERLLRAHASAINGSHTWLFKGKQFILVNGTGEIPGALLKALLGPDRKSARVMGEWDLDREKGVLVLTAVSADGRPGQKEVRLSISPAGAVRINIEKGEQYNLLSFEPKLVVERGVQFPIYELATKIDHEFLQGTWDVVAREVDGRKLAADEVKGSQIRVKGNALTMVSKGAVSRGTFTIDAIGTPGSLDITFTEGAEKGVTYVGIYELDGNTWKFCRAPGGKDRPSSFAGKAGGGQILETIERSTKPAASGERTHDELTDTIEGILSQQAGAWNAGDIDGFMRHYWKSDELTFSSGGRTTRGWETTKENYKQRYPTRERMGNLSFEAIEVTALGDSAALVLGRWHLQREPEPVGGNFSLVFRRVDGAWVIVHDHTSLAPCAGLK